MENVEVERAGRREIVTRGVAADIGDGKNQFDPTACPSPSDLKGKRGDQKAPVAGDDGGRRELLSPEERHYLNKAFVYLQMQREWSALSSIGTLAHYGFPFLPHSTGPNTRPIDSQASGGGSGGGGLFGYFLRSADTLVERAEGWEDFDTDGREGARESPMLRYLFCRFVYNLPGLKDAKLEYWQRHIQPFFDSFAERNLSTTKERGEVTKRRLMSLGFTRIIGTYFSTCMTSSLPHEPSRPSKPIMDRVDNLCPGSMDTTWRSIYPDAKVAYTHWIAVPDMRPDRDKDDNLYIIISRVAGAPDDSISVSQQSYSSFVRLDGALHSLDPEGCLNLPTLPTESRRALQSYLRRLAIILSRPTDSVPMNKMRKLLEPILNSDAVETGLDRVRELLKSAQREDERSEAERKLWIDAGERVRTLKSNWTAYRRALIEEDEMEASINLVRTVPQYRDLPQTHRDAQEWASIWVAGALHYVFAGAPTATEATDLLKSLHSLIPYGALKVGLSLVNPTLAIRAIVALVLGQPAGQASLFQRIVSAVIGSQIKAQKKAISDLRVRIGHSSICDAIEAHVYASFTQRAKTREVSQTASEDILLALLREHGSTEDSDLVGAWHDKLKEQAVTNDDSAQPSKFEELKNLLRVYCLLRDREQVLQVIMEHNTPVALHASIAVFYDAIWKVANASRLADRLGELQAFIDDILKVAQSENNTPAEFIKLAARHDQHLYYFVHELASKDPNLLNPVLRWCRSGLDFIKHGIPAATEDAPLADDASSNTAGEDSRNRKASPRAGVDFDQLVAELDFDTQAEVIQEARDLALFIKYRKVWSDICLRSDLLAVQDVDLALDREEVYASVLLQDSKALDAIMRHRNLIKGRRRPEDGVGFAWYADEDVLDDPFSTRLDWRKAEAVEQRVAQHPDGRNSSRASRSSGNLERQWYTDQPSVNSTPLQVPPPRVQAIKTLLNSYVDVVKKNLDAAWTGKLL